VAQASDLYDAAESLLAAAATAIAAGGNVAPAVQYVSAGPPAIDCCDQLTVHVQLHVQVAMREAGSQAIPQSRPAVQMATFVVTAMRCYPIVEGGVQLRVPDGQKLDAAARVVYLDGWALWNGVRTLIRTDRLFPGRWCRSVDTGPMTPMPTQGGCAGWQLPVLAEVDGYSPL